MLSRARAVALRYRDVQWTFADQALVSGANFLTGVLVARALGVAEFGRFTLLWLIVIFVWNLQVYLVVAPLQSLAPKASPAERPAFYGTVLIQQAAFAGVSLVLLALALALAEWWVPSLGLGSYYAPLAAAALTQQSHDLVRRFHQVEDRPALTFANDVGRYGLQIALLVAAATSGRLDVASALWLISLASLAATLAGAPIPARVRWPEGPLAAILTARWRFGVWLAGSSVLQWVAGNLVMFVAGALIAAEATGALRAAQNIVAGVQVLFFTLANRSAMRASVHYAAGGAPALRQYIGRITRVGAVATVAVLAILCAAPEAWLALVYGAEFAGFGHLILWFSAIALAEFFALMLRSALRAIEETQPVFLAAGVGALMTVLAAHPLVRHWGVEGAVLVLLGASLASVAWLGVALLRSPAYRAGSLP